MSTLYILRHATAEVIRPGQLDSDRCLIEKGRQQALRVANFILKQGLNPQYIYSSPYPRAMQTAAIVCEQAFLAPATELHWLSLDTPAVEVLAEVNALMAKHLGHSVLLIGHEPDLSLMISKLLGAEQPLLKVRKASLSCLQLRAVTDEKLAQRESWVLQWSVPVKFMP